MHRSLPASDRAWTGARNWRHCPCSQTTRGWMVQRHAGTDIQDGAVSREFCRKVWLTTFVFYLAYMCVCVYIQVNESLCEETGYRLSSTSSCKCSHVIPCLCYPLKSILLYSESELWNFRGWGGSLFNVKKKKKAFTCCRIYCKGETKMFTCCRVYFMKMPSPVLFLFSPHPSWHLVGCVELACHCIRDRSSKPAVISFGIRSQGWKMLGRSL